MRRWGLILGTALLLIAGAYLLFRPKAVPQASQMPQVYTVTRGDIRVTVAASGQLQPWETQEVRPGVQGTLLSIVAEGTKVEKGQVLAELDPLPFRRALENAQADMERAQAALDNTRIQGENALASMRASLQGAEVAYANAQATLESARRAFEVSQVVYEAGGVSRQNLLDAQNAYENAQRTLFNAQANLEAQREALRLRQLQLQSDLRAQEAALAQARLALEEARANLDGTKVRAPFAGVVLSVPVAPGAQVGPGTALLTLGDLSAYLLELQVDETDIAKVRVGQEVEVSLEGLPGQTFRGRVEAISPQGETVNNIPVFKVSVRLPYDPRLRPGMSADGEIVVQEVRDVLVVPKRAVERIRNRAYVTILLPNGSTDTVRVVLGPEDATQVAVQEGLTEGAQVVLPRTASPSGSGQGSRSQPGGPAVPFPGLGR